MSAERLSISNETDTRHLTLRERLTQTRVGRMAIKAVTALTIFSAAGSVIAVEAPVASASAAGCVRWGAKQIPGVDVSIPTGQYCFGVNGNGQQINKTDGSFDTPFITDWTEVVRFYDGYGDNYATFTEPVHAGDAYSYHYWETGIHGQARVGRVCGELLSEGVQVASACEGIK